MKHYLRLLKYLNPYRFRLGAAFLCALLVAGLSADEVAVILGRTPGAIRVAQHRALARLAEALDGSAVTR